jgi:hypothetical protein
MRVLALLFSVLSSALYCAPPSPPDLEVVWLKDFVLETRQLHIPGYPDAFNPAIVRWQSKEPVALLDGSVIEPVYVLLFRIRDPITAKTNEIGALFLDEAFNQLTAAQPLNVHYKNPNYLDGQQDPRLLYVNDKLLMVYSNLVSGLGTQDVRRMFVGELVFSEGRFELLSPSCIDQFDGQETQRWQKNWAPFAYQKELFLSYTLNPHSVFYPNLEEGRAETVAVSQMTSPWSWGSLRGGTPALLDEETGEYLAFFHTCFPMKTAQSNNVKMDHYFMGAYTFAAHPPFNLTHVSPDPIVGNNFYNGPLHNTWKPLRVVFPCGFVFDGPYVWVIYGRQDHEVWVAKMDKKALYNSLFCINKSF